MFDKTYNPITVLLFYQDDIKEAHNKDSKTLTKTQVRHLKLGIHQSIYNIILDWVGLQNRSSEAAQSLQNLLQENRSLIISFLKYLHI